MNALDLITAMIGPKRGQPGYLDGLLRADASCLAECISAIPRKRLHNWAKKNLTPVAIRMANAPGDIEARYEFRRRVLMLRTYLETGQCEDFVHFEKKRGL